MTIKRLAGLSVFTLSSAALLCAEDNFDAIIEDARVKADGFYESVSGENQRSFPENAESLIASNTPDEDFVPETPIYGGATTKTIRALVHIIEAGIKIESALINILISATDGVHAKVTIKGSQNEEQTGEGITFSSNGEHNSNDAGYYKGDDIVTGYYIKDLYPEASNSGYINVKNVSVCSQYQGLKAVCGIYHEQSGNGAQQDYGSITISESLEVSYYVEGASVAGLWQKGEGTTEPPSVRGDVAINNFHIGSSGNGGISYGIVQDGNAHIDGNVNLTNGSVVGGSAFGIKGGYYGGNIFANMSVFAYNGDAVGIHLSQSAGSIAGTETTTDDGKIKRTGLYVSQGGISPSGNTIGILLDGATVKGAIEKYSLDVSNMSKNPDDLSIGLYMLNGASVGSISDMDIFAGSYYGATAGFVYDNSEKEMSVGETVSNLNIQAVSHYSEDGVGRVAGIVIGNDANFTVKNSKISIATTGSAYGLAYGKNVSGDAENGGNEADGGAGIFNHTKKDSSGLAITDSVISVYSSNETAREGGGVYGLYIAGDNSYSLGGNAFEVSADDQNAYGVYAAGTSSVSNLTTLTVKSNKNAYGIYLTESAKLDASGLSRITVSSSGENGNAYGIYAANLASGVNIGDLTVSGTATNTYGIYLTGNTENITLAGNLHVSGSGKAFALASDGNMSLVSLGSAQLAGNVSVAGTLHFTQGEFALNTGTISAETWKIGSEDADGNVTTAKVELAENTVFDGNELTFYVKKPETRATQEAVISVAEAATFTALAATINIVLDHNSEYGVGDVITLISGNYDLGNVSSVIVQGSDLGYTYGNVAGGWGITFIPEPSAFGLLAGLGTLTLVASRRRRK